MRRYYIIFNFIYLMIASSAMGATPTNFVLVTMDQESRIARVNTDTNLVDAYITTIAPAFGLAITPDALFAYASLQSADQVVRIDLQTNMVDTTIQLPLGTGPVNLSINPAQTQVWVANGGTASSITIIDIASNTAVGMIDFSPLCGVTCGIKQIAFTPDGKTALVTAGLADNVYKVDVASQMIIATYNFSPNPDPTGIVITPDGKTAYVTSFIPGTSVVPLDVATGALGTPIPTNGGTFSNPDQIVLTPDGSQAFVTNSNFFFGNTVTPITVPGNVPQTPVCTLAACAQSGPIGIAITPDGKTLYVANNGSPGPSQNNIVAIDVATLAVSAPIIVGDPGSAPRLLATVPAIPQAQNPTGAVTGTNVLDVTLCGIIITWDFVNNPSIIEYQIFQNGVLIGTVLATALNQFIIYTSVCADLCTSNDTFSIAAVTDSGLGQIIPVVIQ
jgi:YVTN family beta-propeller protein